MYSPFFIAIYFSVLTTANTATTSTPSTCAQWVSWRQLQGNNLTLQATVDSSDNFNVQIQAALVPNVAQYNCGWLFNVSFVNAQNQSQYSQKCNLTAAVKQAPQVQTNCSPTSGTCISSWSSSVTSSAIFYCFPWINASSVPQILPQIQVYFYDPVSANILAFETFNLTLLLAGNVTALTTNTFTGITLVSVLPVISSTVNSSTLDINATILSTLYPTGYFNNSNVQLLSGAQLTEGQSYYASHTFGAAYQNLGVYLAVQTVTLLLPNGSTLSLVFQEQARTGNGTLFVVGIPIATSVTTSNLTLTVLSTVTTSSSVSLPYRRRRRRMLAAASSFSQYYQSSLEVTITPSSDSSTASNNNCLSYYWGGPSYNICELQLHLALYICMLVLQLLISGPIALYVSNRPVFWIEAKSKRRIRRDVWVFVLLWSLFGGVVLTLTGPFLPVVSILALFSVWLDRIITRKRFVAPVRPEILPTTATASSSRAVANNSAAARNSSIDANRHDTESNIVKRNANSDSHLNSITLPGRDGHAMNLQTVVDSQDILRN